MKTIAIYLLSLFALPALSQQANSTQAQSIIKDLRDKYASYDAFEASFKLDIFYGNGEEETQTGNLIQKGQKYMMDATSQAVYCDGKDIWIHLKDNEEVQINDYEEGEENLNFSPTAVLAQYDNGDYEYALINESKIKGTLMQEIEFKPISDDSEFSKIRIYIEKSSNDLEKLMVFSKDGTRLSLDIKDVKINGSYSENIFKFDRSKNPKVHIEDLRID